MNGLTETGTHRSDEYGGQKLFTLLGNLRNDLKDMLRREMDLLKAELGDKAASLGKQGGLVAAGGMIAFTGAIFVMIGLCTLIAFGLHQAGLSVGMATWISFFTFGLAVATGGYFLVHSGLKQLKKTSVAPNETLATVKEIAKRDTSAAGLVASADIKADKSDKTRRARVAAEKGIEKVQNEFAEVQARMNPKYMLAATCTAAKRRPRMTAGIGAAVLALGYAMKRRRNHRAKNPADETYELLLD